MFKGERILLVEDSDFQREAAHSLLEELGYTRIFAAKDGIDALHNMEKRRVDLIISDWEMPEMDGLELLKRVRGTPDLKDIPFIILTAKDEKDQIVQAVKCGVTDYIIKPMERETLKGKLKKIFTKRPPFSP